MLEKENLRKLHEQGLMRFKSKSTQFSNLNFNSIIPSKPQPVKIEDLPFSAQSEALLESVRKLGETPETPETLNKRFKSKKEKD